MVTASPPPIRVSVVIPHYNDLSGLRICWAALQAQTIGQDAFEIVVADNNSSCGLDTVRHAVPGAIVVPAPIQGAGPARNAGVGASRGPVIAFIDSDCVPAPDWLQEGLAAVARFDFVGGRVDTFAERPDQPNAVEAFEIVFNFNFKRYIEKIGFTGTGNMFVRRDVFERVGGFRKHVSEDMDWSFRARAQGFRLGYADHAVVGHPARRQWSELRARWSRMVDEDFELSLERRRGRLDFAIKALLMPASVVPHGLVVLRAGRLPSLEAKLGALAILARLRMWRAARMLNRAIRGRAQSRNAGAEASV